MKHARYLKNAAVISLGGLIAKGIGALYRIPLTGLLGGYGMGLYQMAYPFFCVLLTFSSAGIPSAFSRMIARERARGGESSGTVKAALKLFALIGLVGTITMCLFAPLMSGLQGEKNLALCYVALAPSVFLVALIAVLRGYFQGKNNMAPTAISEIVEQIFKALLGLLFAYRFAENPARAVAYTLAAVSLSELAALGYLLIRYKSEGGRALLTRRGSGYSILSAALPVMAATSLLPLSQMADSVILVRLLSRHTAQAVALYGLFTGGAISLINLPASVCYGFVAATVPAVASSFARGEEEEGRRRAVYALLVTLLLSAPCAVGLFLFAKPIVGLLFPTLGAEDSQALISLVRQCSVSAATLAGVDTLSASLTGMGRAKFAALSMLVAVMVKFGLQFLLVGNPRFSVAGAAIAANACYLVAFFLDLFYTVRKAKRQEGYDYDRKSRRHGGRSHVGGVEGPQGGGRGARSHKRVTLG